MNPKLTCVTLMALVASMTTYDWKAAAADQEAVLVIHGGAGVVDREKLTPELERQYRDALTTSLRAGYDVLNRADGTSIDSVEAAIRVLEDSPLFNAGKGAAFTREGRNELDAAMMDGKTRRAGAVAGVTRIRNPITAARAVMEKSEHVLMIGEGAERFARSQGLPEENPLYFWTEQRWKALQEAREKHEQSLKSGRATMPEDHFGTLGAVAIDRFGNLAAGTSTGGLTFKLPGRVGDSPLIGAGTYADNGTCAVSCTGHGEVFIRNVVAYDIAAAMKYGRASLAEAVEEVFKRLPQETGGVGGLIAMDRQGRFATPFNTSGMYRGHVTRDGKFHTAIFDK